MREDHGRQETRISFQEEGWQCHPEEESQTQLKRWWYCCGGSVLRASLPYYNSLPITSSYCPSRLGKKCGPVQYGKYTAHAHPPKARDARRHHNVFCRHYIAQERALARSRMRCLFPFIFTIQDACRDRELGSLKAPSFILSCINSQVTKWFVFLMLFIR